MYDGYIFGGVEIYNPWSIIKYADRRVLEPFWVNTSGNELIIKTVSDCKTNVKILIEKLLLGEIFMKFKNILRGTSLIDYISFSD